MRNINIDSAQKIRTRGAYTKNRNQQTSMEKKPKKIKIFSIHFFWIFNK